MDKRNGKIKLNYENNNLLYDRKYKNEKNYWNRQGILFKWQIYFFGEYLVGEYEK